TRRSAGLRRRSRCSGPVAVVPVGLGEGELRRALGEERLLTTGDLLLIGGIEPFRRNAVVRSGIRRARPLPGQTPVEDLLGSDLTEPGQSDDPLPQLLSGGPRRVRDLVEETELIHLLELHDRGGDEEVSGPRIAEDLGQTTSGAGRVDEAEFGRRDAEDRAGGGDADIAGGGDLRASAHAVAFDGCDRRGRRIRHGRLRGGVELPEVGQRDTEVADVRAGGEVASGSSDRERPDRVIGIDGGDDLWDGTPHRAGERIALLGPIDDEGSDPTGDGEVETLVIDRTVGTVSGHMLCLPCRTQPRLSGTSRWS